MTAAARAAPNAVGRTAGALTPKTVFRALLVCFIPALITS